MRLHILTTVWGDEFVGRFLDVTLRSLAAPGNLADLAARHDVVYHIHTPAADKARIEAHPVFQRLAATVKFEFQLFALDSINAADSMSHWAVWNWAIPLAKAEDAYIITVAADHVFARGALLRWAELFEQGYLAIYCPGIQIVAETAAEELARRFAGDAAIDLPPQDFRDVMFRHLHPVMITMFRDSPRWMSHPEFLLRGVRGEGMVQRIMTSHAVAFNPARIRMTENFCPLEQFDKVAFEPSWFLSAEPFFKYLQLYLRRWRMDDVTLSHYGIWGDGFFYEANLRESAVTHAYPLHEALPDHVLRRETLAAGAYVRQMQASRLIHRLWRELRDNGLYQGARWLAAAHIHGRLRRRLAWRGPLTLFVPSDDVLERITAAETNRLLMNGGAALIATLKAHVAPGRFALTANDMLAGRADGPIMTAAGVRFAPDRAGDIRVLRGPIRIDDTAIYVVDRPLIALALRPPRTHGRLAQAARLPLHFGRRALAKVKRVIVPVVRRHRRVHRLVTASRDLWATRRNLVLPHEQPPPKPIVLADAAVEAYRRALAARVLAVLRELYGFYDERVLTGSGRVAAPAISLAALDQHPQAQVVAWLRQAVAAEPAFAEAWLELGHACAEAGDVDGALAAFGEARALRPTVPRPRGRSDLRTVAALERAALLQNRGEAARGLQELDALNIPPPVPWTMHLWRGRVLLDLGRAEEALAAFERCLEWGHWEGRFAAHLPRDFAALQAALASRVAQ